MRLQSHCSFTRCFRQFGSSRIGCNRNWNCTHSCFQYPLNHHVPNVLSVVCYRNAEKGESIIDRYYAITYSSTIHFAVGWVKFLLSLEISDSDFYHAVCGGNSSYSLRAKSAEFYREVLYHYLQKKCCGAFENVVSRLMLSIPSGNEHLPSFNRMVTANDLRS